MANNRELSQLASFVTVDDTSKTIAFGSTIASLNVTGVGTFGSLTVGGVPVTAATALHPTLLELNVTGVSTLSTLNVTGISTLGAGVTALPISGYNIGIGSLSNSYVTGSGVYNVQIGHEQAAINGDRNVAIGRSAGKVTTGSDNVFLGNSAGVGNTGGCQNIFIGNYAGKSNACGSFSNFLGYGAGCSNVTGSFNNFFGWFSGCLNTTGSYNNFFGESAGRNNTTGSYNIFIGCCAGNQNTVGDDNVFLGRQAGYANTDGVRNVSIGKCSGRNLTGGDNNVFLGAYSGQSTTTGELNVGVGYNALGSNTTGIHNNVLGYQAGGQVSTGSSNVLIGHIAGYGITTGTNNIAIGQSAGTDAVLNFSASVAMGATSNIIVLGNNSHTKSYIKIDWTVTSDERDKNILGEVPLGLEFVQGLEPIKFQFKNRESGEVTDDTLRYGFKAQQVAELEGEPNVIADVADPENLKVTSAHLVPVLVNAIKELSVKVAELEARLDVQ